MITTKCLCLLLALLSINLVYSQYLFDATYMVTIAEREDPTLEFYNKTTETDIGSGIQETKKFWINGVETPDLYVERGKTYMFRYNSTDAYKYVFYLFKNDTGSDGLGCVLCGEPEENGYFKGFFSRSSQMQANGQILYWAVPSDAPDTLWYGDRLHGWMGGKIIITGTGTPDPLFVTKPGYYVVQDVVKIDHPWMTPDDLSLCPTNLGFAINGYEGLSLILEVGVTYTFLLLNSPSNPFVLPTYSSLGEVGDPLVYGKLYAEGGKPKIWTFTVDKNPPDYSFYQSLLTYRAGGHITFLDSKMIDYHVWVDLKTPAHPNYGKGDPRGYLINGEEGKSLTLERTRVYKFLVESDASFPFTLADFEGGATFFIPGAEDAKKAWRITNLGWGDPARHLESVYRYNKLPTSQNYMLMTFTPDDKVSGKIYYESGLNTWMGSDITVVNKCEAECIAQPCTDNNKLVVKVDVVKDCNGEYTVEQK